MGSPTKITALPETFECDVLVIGGGLAGTMAAITARDRSAEVILVEKAKVARSGASTFAAGVMLAPQRGDDLESWHRELVENGEFFNDQDWVETLLNHMPAIIDTLDEWGVPFEKDASGKLARIVGRGHQKTRLLMFHGPEFMEKMRQQVVKRQIRLVERVMVTDLLTADGKHPTRGSVIGAVGFHVRTGQPVVFKARSVVLATGGVRGKGFFFCGNTTGDGIAAAYRAGAEVRNMEFAFAWGGWMFERKYFAQGMNMFQGHGAVLVNASGEHYMDRYDPVLKDRARHSRLVLAMAKEGVEGRSPLFMDMTGFSDEAWQRCRRVLPQAMRIFDESGIQPWKQKVVFELPSTGFSSLVSGVVTTVRGESNLPGLFVTGQDSGFPAHGTYSVGGVNLASCCVGGRRAGEFAARYAKTVEGKQPVPAQIEALLAAQRIPLAVKRGVTPDDIDARIQDLTHAAPYAHFKSEGRIDEVITGLKKIRALLPQVAAPDAHELVKAHEMASFLLCCELIYRAARERKETRAGHYREDFPYRDDANWLTWIVLQNQGTAEPAISLRPVPVDRYKVKPPDRERKPPPLPVPVAGKARSDGH